MQADLKTFHQHGVYGMSVVTLLTVQNTRGVTKVETLSPELVDAQLQSVVGDIAPGAAKSGALGNQTLVAWLASRAKTFTFPLVVDPVMISKHGHPLLDEAARATVVQALLPVTSLVTPNTHEAAALTGRAVETLAQARDAARALVDLGARSALVKGGHLEGRPVDVLWHDGQAHEFHADRVHTSSTHGTGCTLSAAITARLAMGTTLPVAVDLAKRWLTAALATAEPLGHGVGPVNHFAPLEGSR